MASATCYLLLLLQVYTLRLSSDQSDSHQLALLGQDVTSWYYKYDPMSATAADNYEYNDLLPSRNRSLHPILKASADDFLVRLSKINRDQLASSTERRSYDVLQDMLQLFVEGYQWRDFQGLNPVGVFDGFQANYEMYIDLTPFHTIGDYENYLARLHRLPGLLQEYTSLARDAIQLNKTYHNVSMTIVFEQINVILSANSTSSYFYSPFKTKLENDTAIFDDTKKDLRKRAEEAVSNVLAAFSEFKTFLETEYLPKTRTFWGVGGYPNGSDYYTACLRWYISDPTYAPDKVHQVGLSEVTRIEGNIQKILNKQGFNGTVPEYLRSLMNDSRFLLHTGDEILQAYRSIIFDRIQPLLPKFFTNMPNLPIEVQPTSVDGIGGSYTTGSKDGARPGIFNANVMRPQDSPTFGFMSLALHEAIPGHHLQISYGLVADVPDFLNNIGIEDGSIVPFAIPRYPAFVEGWALYAEMLGEEMGVYKDDYELIGRYTSEIFRACRLVVDTGLHFYGWDRDRAVEYMLNYTTDTRQTIEIEVDRYLTIPGQACAYKIGEIKIRDLRAKAEKALGDRFDIKAFHSVVLGTGALPLRVLENAVDEWIAEVQVA